MLLAVLHNHTWSLFVPSLIPYSRLGLDSHQPYAKTQSSLVGFVAANLIDQLQLSVRGTKQLRNAAREELE